MTRVRRLGGAWSSPDAPVVFRRSRGYVPRAVRLTRELPRPVLGTRRAAEEHVLPRRRTRRLARPARRRSREPRDVRVVPEGDRAARALSRRSSREVVAHDLHPDYLSTRYARGRSAGVRTVAVQHHHAHVASAHGRARRSIGPVLGARLRRHRLRHRRRGVGRRGAGRRLRRVQRLATFRAVPLAGGDAAIRQPWRMALAARSTTRSGATPPLDATAAVRAACRAAMSRSCGG